jgi:CheY-like chemotaxis protein
MSSCYRREDRILALRYQDELLRQCKPRDYLLLVEDNREVREGLVEIIRGEGYPVVSCSDGQVALNRLCSSSDLPIMIVLDFLMPRMDGWAFLAERNRNEWWKTIPVLGISASQALAERGDLPEGVFEFLRKPFQVEAILRCIERHWSARRARFSPRSQRRLDW